MKAFFQSLLYPIKGIYYLTNHKKLLKHLIIPVTIDLIIAIVCLIFLYANLNDIVNWIVPASESFYYSLLRGTLQVLGWLIILIMFPFILIVSTSVVDPIFRGFIYSKTKAMEGYPEENLQFNENIVKIAKGILSEIKKLALYLLITIFLLLFNLVPLIGSIIYLVLQFMLTAFFLGWEYLTPYLEEKKFAFVQQFRFAKQNSAIILGFGIPATFLLMIPIAQAFFLTTHTIGGALLSIKLEKEKHISTSVKEPQ